MSNRFRRSLLASVAFSSAIAAIPATAQSQSGPATEEPASSENREIVVTGSRIARKDFTSQSPIVTVQQDMLVDNAGVTLERGLNQLPQVVPSRGETNPESNGSPGTGGGQARVNLRGLGAARTLVLLNGRRLQPSGEDNSVDLTAIPQALISNVELITGGASAVYGSDAVAGVVNFQLNRNFRGIEIDGRYGNTEEGDGETKQVYVTLGTPFAEGRGHVALSVGYADRSKLVGSDRPFFSQSTLSGTLDRTLIPNQAGTQYSQAALDSIFGAYGIPAGTVRAGANSIGVNADGTLFSTGSVLSNFRSPTYDVDPASRYVARLSSSGARTGVLYRSGLDNLIRAPQERYSAFFMGDYEISEHLKPFVTFNYVNYKTLTQTNPIGSNAGVGLTLNAASTTIPTDLRVLLDSRPNPSAPVVIVKRLVELGNRVQNYRRSIFQFTGGFTGSLPIKDWSYELYGSYGRDNSNNIIAGYASVRAYNILLGAADGGAGICAGGYDAFDPDFVLSAACHDFLARTLHVDQELEQKDGALNIQGGLFNLPAGEVRFAAGLAARSNNYVYEPDDTIKQGDAANFARTFATSGRTSVKEAYGELLVPVLRDLPLIESLNLGGAFRISDYNTVGTASTYKVNVDWQLGHGLMLRGGVQRAIRAPSVGELFSPRISALQNVAALDAVNTRDPCDTRGTFRTGANAAQVRALCLAQGLPAALIDTYIFNGNNALATRAGNPDLIEETADSHTIGGVWRSPFLSPWLRRLSLSVDYYNIKIKNAVGNLTLPQLFSFCFNLTGDTNPSYDPANPYCAQIRRDPASGALSNETLIQNFNLATISTAGIDVQFDWGVNFADVGLGIPGTFNLNLVATRLLHFRYQSTPTQPSFDYRGSVGSGLLDGGSYPTLKMVISPSYSVGNFDIGARFRYTSAMIDSSKITSPTSTNAGVPSYTYIDLAAGYRVNDNLSLRAGVTNLTDSAPPVVGGVLGETDLSLFDVLGRSYYLQAVVRF